MTNNKRYKDAPSKFPVSTRKFYSIATIVLSSIFDFVKMKEDSTLHNFVFDINFNFFPNTNSCKRVKPLDDRKLKFLRHNLQKLVWGFLIDICQ